MKIFITGILLMFLATFAVAQTGTGAAPSGSNGGGGFMAASDDLRITSPTIGEKVGNTHVTVRYEITNRGADAAPSPTYRVQLDGRDASETLDTSYTFTGLAPGDHTVTVQLVDANHNPIGGSQVVVHFKTFTPAAANPGASGTTTPQTTGALAPPKVVKAKLPLPSRNELPDAGGELPLLSLVGFGVLFGGVISALRTRK